MYMFFTKLWTKCPYLCLGFFDNTIIIIPGNYVGPLKGWVAYDMNHEVRNPVFVVCEHKKHTSVNLQGPVQFLQYTKNST